MKKLLLFISIVNCVQMNLFSQSVYGISRERDIIIGLVSLEAGIAPFFINNEPNNVPHTFHKKDINIFDRFSVFSYNRSLDLFSDYYCAFTLASFPLISVIPNVKHKGTISTYFVMYCESLLLTYGTVFSLKSALIRYRPYMYVDGVPGGKEKDYYNSFPSGAAAFSFLGVTFFATTFSREFPESRLKLPLIIGAYTLAAGTGAMRIVSGSHFLSDVLAGAAIGSLYGWLIPRLHIKNEQKNFSITPAMNGIMLSFEL